MVPVNIQQRIGQKTANLAQPNGKTMKLETPHPIIQSNYIGMYTWHVRACGLLQHFIDFPCAHTGHETNLCCHQRSPAVPCRTWVESQGQNCNINQFFLTFTQQVWI